MISTTLMTFNQYDHIKNCAIVPAAGSGTRLGFSTPKAFVDLGGLTLLEHTLDGLSASGVIDLSIVLVSKDMEERAQELLSERSHRWNPMTVLVAQGGHERRDSVHKGLALLGNIIHQHCPAAAEDLYVAVHDAARCLTPPRMIHDLVHIARSTEVAGAIPVLPVSDTIKTVSDVGIIQSTPDRNTLRAAQTPQVFPFVPLLEAYDNGPQHATDDSSLMEIAGHAVRAIPGHAHAMKITTIEDYERAINIHKSQHPSIQI